jgi:ion channel-forming bestrophin family protein
MIVKRHLNLFKVLGYVRFEVGLGMCSSLFVYLLYDVAGFHKIGFPMTLPTILGSALAIFLGFRNSTAYARWSEAAVLWSTISNNSRIMARLVVTFAQAHNHTPTFHAEQASEWQARMIYRQIAWAHALRLLLREHDCEEASSSVVVKNLLTKEEWRVVSVKENKPTSLIILQGHGIYDAMRVGILQSFDFFQLENFIAQLSYCQAQCERLKHIPIPQQYTFFTRLCVWVFIVTIPLCFVQPLSQMSHAWVIIPLTTLLACVFGIVERTGAIHEAPFQNKVTDVPLLALCVDVDRDLREILGETNLPDKSVAEKGFLF